MNGDAHLASAFVRLNTQINGGHFDYRIGILPKETTKMPLEITEGVTTENRVRLTATPKTQSGNPAEVDGPLMFSVQSGEAAAEQVSQLVADIVPGSTPSDVTVLVTGDADLGEGFRQISDIVLIRFAGPQAESLGLSAEILPK